MARSNWNVSPQPVEVSVTWSAPRRENIPVVNVSRITPQNICGVVSEINRVMGLANGDPRNDPNAYDQV